MNLSLPESSFMRGNDARPAKRRKYPLSTPGPSREIIQDFLMDFKPSQLRQVIDVALKNGDVKRCIRHIHARLPRKSPIEDHPELLGTGWAPVKDEVIESIEISPMPERQLALMPAPQETRQPQLHKSSVEKKKDVLDKVTQPLQFSEVAKSSSLPTPRASHEPFPKEIPMTPEPYLTPEPELNTWTSRSLPNTEIQIRPPPQTITCNCRSGCFSTRCKCYKSGRGCSPSPFSGCKCDSCANMLNDLSTFFGTPQSPPGLSIIASPDLLKWIRRESRNGRFDLIHPHTVEELRSILVGVECGDLASPPAFSAFSSGNLREIGRAWMRPDITDEEREDLKKELFKEAFGVIEGEPTKEYWCFCTNEWKQTTHFVYCTKCDECRDIREWHCGGCGERNIGGSCICERASNEDNGFEEGGSQVSEGTLVASNV